MGLYTEKYEVACFWQPESPIVGSSTESMSDCSRLQSAKGQDSFSCITQMHFTLQANTEIGLDPKHRVIKRLGCTMYIHVDVSFVKIGSTFLSLKEVKKIAFQIKFIYFALITQKGHRSYRLCSRRCVCGLAWWKKPDYTEETPHLG